MAPGAALSDDAQIPRLDEAAPALGQAVELHQLQAIGLRAGHPAHLHVTASVRADSNLFAALRLGARQTTPRRPPLGSTSRSPLTLWTARAKSRSRKELTQGALVVGLQAARAAAAPLVTSTILICHLSCHWVGREFLICHLSGHLVGREFLICHLSGHLVGPAQVICHLSGHFIGPA